MEQLTFDDVGPDYFQDAPTSMDGVPTGGDRKGSLSRVWKLFYRRRWLGLTDNEMKGMLGENPGLVARRFELRHVWCRCGHVHLNMGERFLEEGNPLVTSNTCRGTCKDHAFEGLLLLDHDRTATPREPRKPHIRQVYPRDFRVRTRVSGGFAKAGAVHVCYPFYGRWEKQDGD